MKQKHLTRGISVVRMASATIALGLAFGACTPKAEPQVAKTPDNGARPSGSSGRRDVDPQTSAKTDEIVARYVEARGGASKLHAIKSLRTIGTARFGDGDFSIEASYGTVAKRPGGLRVEVTFQGLTAVDAYDGAEAWSTQPFGGRRDPFKQSADEAKGLAVSGSTLMP